MVWVLMGVLSGCGTSAPAPMPVPAEVPAALPAEGKTLYPAVEVSEIPSGAWMCDMGTVHYAAGEKNDGKCPICGMELTQKP